MLRKIISVRNIGRFRNSAAPGNRELARYTLTAGANGSSGIVASGDAARLETELGYGLPALGGHGTATPYAGFGLAQGGERAMRAGVRLGLGAGFDLDIEAERNAADTGHGIGLDLRIRS